MIDCPLDLECSEFDCPNWRECCYVADEFSASEGHPYVYRHLINCLEVVESRDGLEKAIPLPYSYCDREKKLEVLFIDYQEFGWCMPCELPYYYSYETNTLKVIWGFQIAYGFIPAVDLLHANYYRKRTDS